MDSEIQHFSHDHILRPIRWTRDGVSCSICNRADIPGEDSGYGCHRCLYFINKACAELPQHMNHPLHALHSLTLAKRSSTTSCCYYCDKPFEDDKCYTYGCDQCPNLYMHTACATIPLPTITTPSSDVDGGEDRVVQYVCHQHPMKLVEGDGKSGEAKCFACQAPGSGPAYSCNFNAKCKNFLHKSCAELPEKIQHPFHWRHPLMLRVSKPLTCHSCCKRDCRLIYCCREDGCDINLGIECAFLKTAVKCLSHEHVLYLVDEASCNIHCDGCHRSYKQWVEVIPTTEVNSTQSYLFRCLECDFNLHFLCGPMSSTIKYEYHMHHLTLVEHLNIEDDSDEFYCDACERQRDPNFRAYWCKECKYVAHIHCVLSEIMEVMKLGDTQDVELKALGENRWELGIQIDEEKDAVEHLTMSDIMDRLTEDEKKMLVYPFGFDSREHNVYARAAHNFYRQLNSRFNPDGSSIEDIERIHHLFSFGSTELANFHRELHWFVPEIIKVDDEYLRQKVENVGGYMVPKTLVPILKTLLRRYRDLGRYNLTQNMKSITATLLCIVIDKMCRTMAEDITKDDLKHWYFYLYAIKKLAGFEIIELESFDDFVLPTFLGFEVTRREKDISEKLDLRIASLREELKRCEENREKLKTYASAKSDFIKDCLSKASEWKRKFLGDKWF